MTCLFGSLCTLGFEHQIDRQAHGFFVAGRALVGKFGRWVRLAEVYDEETGGAHRVKVLVNCVVITTDAAAFAADVAASKPWRFNLARGRAEVMRGPGLPRR